MERKPAASNKKQPVKIHGQAAYRRLSNIVFELINPNIRKWLAEL
jgi:hypothetical protein